MEIKELKKRGRKRKDKNYFGQAEENAIIEYINEKSSEKRNVIYRTKLHEPISKMVHIIVRKYKVYIGNENIRDVEVNVLAHTVEQITKFKPEKGNKSYSYLGTVAKHHVMLIGKQLYKKDTSHLDFDSVYDDEFEENHDFKADIVTDTTDYAELKLKLILNKLKEGVENNSFDKKDILVVNALIHIFDNMELYLFDYKSTAKQDRNKLFLIIKERTNLTTKDIKNSVINISKYHKDIILQIFGDK